MNAPFIQFLRNIRSSYWFVPLLMVVGAAVLSVITRRIDSSGGLDVARSLGLGHFVSSGGARATLSTIAGSMIGVAGVTFSMTLVSVSFATAQFGPRLIGNFMRDRGNQVSLGAFTATFVYSLLILGSVHGAGEGDGATAFLPRFSVLTALAMSLACIGVLVYFIHHVPETINVSRITSRIGRGLASTIERRAQLPGGCSRATCEAPPQAGASVAIGAERPGYVQALNDSKLFDVACEHDLTVTLLCGPGDFVTLGSELMLAEPAERVTDGVRAELADGLAIGMERTVDQDELFLAQQLVEILGRALSPGINDPFTAVGCIHWFQSALTVAVGVEDMDPRCLVDADDRARLIAGSVTFEKLVDATLTASLQYVAADRNAALEALRSVGHVLTRTGNEEYREVLLRYGERLVAAAKEALPVAVDRDAVDRAGRLLRRIGADSPDSQRSLEWVRELDGAGVDV